MAKVISQETFDDVLKENIVDFSMSVDEAREETVQQFEAQGINLANIIKDLTLNEQTGKPVLVESIEKLKLYASSDADDEFEGVLNGFIQECNKSVPHRVMATKNGATTILYDLLQKHKEDPPKIRLLVQANVVLINKQPDIFDEKSLALIKWIIDTKKDDSALLKSSLKWLQKACLLHENNRQMIMNGDIVALLKPLLHSGALKEVCTLFRYLILDDDIRIEFGKAHDHARLIASECLEDITMLLEEFKSDEELIGELMLTLASLTVRSEYCAVIEKAGGLNFVLEVMAEHPEKVQLVRESLKLVKALGGNDKVKVALIQHGAAALVTYLMSFHKANEGIAKLALACISTLTLRVQENSLAFFDAGAAEIIVETMKIHPSQKDVIRNAAWSIRNMVSRCRDKCDLFISAGVEDCLNDALRDHPTISQDVKSALRDLNLKVQLAEEWKNKAEKEITKDF